MTSTSITIESPETETHYNIDDWYGNVVINTERGYVIYVYIMLITIFLSLLVIVFGVLLDQPTVSIIGGVLLLVDFIGMFCIFTPLLSGILKLWNSVLNSFRRLRNSLKRTLSWNHVFTNGRPRISPIKSLDDTEYPFDVVYHPSGVEVVMNRYVMGNRTSTPKVPPKRCQWHLEQDNLQLSDSGDEIELHMYQILQPVHQTQPTRSLQAGYQPEPNRRSLHPDPFDEATGSHGQLRTRHTNGEKENGPDQSQ